MSGKYENIHLANNLEALELLSQEGTPNFRKLNFDQISRGLKVLHKEITRNVLDQEVTFILLFRSVKMYERLNQLDPSFAAIRYKTEQAKVLKQFEETRGSLEGRYAARLAGSVKSTVPREQEKSSVLATTPERIFKDDFINCEELYRALGGKYQILLVDARPDYDYMQSRLKDEYQCINVPDQCITAGLSAHALGKKLPDDTQEVWDRRDSFDVLVLFDWNTEPNNLNLTKLQKLRVSLVEWDYNRKYRERPVILKGGYLALLHTYPFLCLNTHVYLQQKDDELDDLLNIDDIKYPTESDNKSLAMGIPETRPDNSSVGAGDEIEPITKESLLRENKEITLNRQNVISQLLSEENAWKDINEMLSGEKNVAHVQVLENKDMMIRGEIARLQKLLQDLTKKKDDVRRQYDLNYEFNPEDETKNEDLKEITLMEESDSEKLRILEVVADERKKALQMARALKPKALDTSGKNNNLENRMAVIPAINRATKPSNKALRLVVGPLDVLTNGLIGLRNLRNTCYMNTVVQCLKSIPAIKNFFCKGSYSSENIRNPAAIIHETASLIRQLWSKSMKFIEPMEFYNKIGALESTYRLGNHEDCMEFFLFLLNHLSEDCSYDQDNINVNTLPPTKRAWYNQFEGKQSVFINSFYHQIRIIQNCAKCDQKTFKFEIESTFMLSVPEQDFILNDRMKEYMADFVIQEYCCSKCKKPVKNKKEICSEPKILVIVLKRYRQTVVNGVVTLTKIESKAHFNREDFKFGRSTYKLNAIAMHSGDLNHGHYTAAALTPKGWYEFNDEMVRPINITDDSIKQKACAFFYSICDE